ncbi:MAG: glycoside hydrolase family 19 protein [Fibrobacterota bacterium]
MNPWKNIALMIPLLLLPVRATVFPLTVNQDAEITISRGADETRVSVQGGTTKSVELPWLTTTDEVSISAVSQNPRYYDTTFTTTIEILGADYPAWDADKSYENTDTVSHAGKIWYNEWWANAGDEPGVHNVWKEVVNDDPYSLTIDLAAKPLPEDTAFIPFHVNVDATVFATIISMIGGGDFIDTIYEFDLKAKTKDTLLLPVRDDGTATISTEESHRNASSRVKTVGGRHYLQVGSRFRGGEAAILTPAGKCVQRIDLSAGNQHDASIWDVSAGMYMIAAEGPHGARAVHKINHRGGDLRMAVSFSETFRTGGLVAGDPVSMAPRSREAARYTITVTADDPAYNDTTYTLELTGKMNASQNIYLVDPDGNNFDQLVDSATYDEMFPNRYGLGYGDYINDELPEDTSKINKLASDGDYDFYTYESLVKAMDSMSRIEVDLYQLKGHDYMHRIVWRNKETGNTRSMINNVAYNDYKETNEEYLVSTIDYGNFCQEGDVATRKQELAAFFGNISHETTGAGVDEKSKTWGLYWREEVDWQKGSTELGYVDQYPNELYPPTAGQSYHGRGPIQITHNVNYGQLSEFFYGDKQILLDNPDKLVPEKPEDATVAYMSAIWFWMTPQAPKPSCHDVMVGNWVPSAEDKSKNLDESTFGMTVYIINGGLECGNGDGDHRVVDRAEFYKRYARLLSITPEDYCDCGNMK